jgi:TRAP-type mannitol/chloroaromatic compound transport system permease small subunit
MNRMLDAIDNFNSTIGKAVSVFSLFTAGAILYEIFMRFVFARPTVWASESTAFACSMMYMLAGALVMREDGHMRIDMVHSKLTPRTRAIVDCLTYPFFVLYMVALLWAGTVYTFDSIAVGQTTSSAWDPPIYPSKMIMLLGMLLLLIQGTAQLIRNLMIVCQRKAK